MSEKNKTFHIDSQQSDIQINLTNPIHHQNTDEIISGNVEESQSALNINLSEISQEKTDRVEFVQNMIHSGHLQTIRDVIQRWKCQNDFLPNGETLLHVCQQIHSIECTKILLEMGADPTLHKEKYFSACYYAVRYDRPQYMKLYLSHMNKKQLEHLKNEKFYFNGNSLLHCAVWFCDSEMTRLLLSYGFDPNKQNDSGETPLHLLDNRHDKSTARVFFNTPNALQVDLSIRDYEGHTAEEAIYSSDIKRILRNERRKEILTLRKMLYEERRLIYLKKQARIRIRKQKKLREKIKANGGLEYI